MPKTDKEYTKNINVRISKAQYKKWSTFIENNLFTSISKLVRYVVDRYVDGDLHETKNIKEDNSLNRRINEINEKYEVLSKENKEILKLIAKKTTKEIPMLEYRKEIIFNLLQEQPRTEEQINKIISDLELKELLTVLNDLMKIGLIEYENGFYRTVI